MRIAIAAALALLVPSALGAQVDYSIATPASGNWSYAAVAGGTEASFATSATLPQLTIRCTTATRRVTIARPASSAAPFMTVWTSSLARDVPASFNPLTGRMTIELAAYDPLLDAVAFSRGRLAVGVKGQALLVVPAFPEIARVVEDCRG